MSKTIDEKVVEMKFDNKDFENNVQSTLLSLDKLKKSLNLPESAKGLDNLSNQLSKVDVSPLTKGLESCKSQFSALEVMGVTALVNITNTAVNAGKKIVSALTLEPIKSGFEEYELKMDSVRTIMASTGADIKTVNKYLDELNEYSDRTIYKFSDMTQNIGKFTNAGVKLEDAVIAMKGLSNEAALSGANTNEAARAMYNFSQALSMGYVQLIDWKSIENANMATVEFKQQLLDTAVALGIITKASDGTYKSGKHNYTLQAMFKDGLKDQWLTTEVLLATLKDYGDEETEIGKKAYEAAEKVSKFTQMWDVMKETAQSGWAKTWELIFGDMTQARALFTPLTNFFTNIIQGFDDARNAFLESALAKNFKSLLDTVKTSADSIKEVVSTVQDYAQVVDDIIYGKFGNGQARWDKLTEEGYDWAYAQNLVNEKLGSSVRHATDFTGAQEELTEAQNDLTESTTDYIVELTKLSDEELKNKGMTDEQVAALRSLQDASDKTGIELKYLLDHIDEIDGRFLLMNSFKNIGMSLYKVFKSIGTAWRDAFPPMSSDTLFNIIAGLHKFSTIISSYVEKNIDNLTRTLKGLFAILDIITTFAGGGLKIAFTILQGVLEGLGYSFGGVLEVTAFLGDKISWLRDIINGGIVKGVSLLTRAIKTVIVAFRNWYNSGNILGKGLELVSSAFKSITKTVKDFIANNSVLKSMISGIQTLFEKIKSSINSIDVSKFKDIGINIIEGLVNGIKSGVKKVVESIINIGKTILNAFASVLGIHSPSTEFFAMGSYIIEGLINGLTNGSSKIVDTIKNLGNKIKEVFENVNIGRWLAIAIDAIVANIAPKRLVAAYGLAKTLLGGFGVYVFNIFETIQNRASNAEFITNSITKIADSFKYLFTNIKDWFGGIKDAENPAQYIILGLVNGIKNGFTAVTNVMLNLAKIVYTTIKKALGIASPSKVFFAIGGFIVLGLVAGMKDKLGFITDGIKSLASKLVDTFKQIDFGKIFAAGLAVGLLYTVNKIIKLMNSIVSIAKVVTSPLSALSNMLNNIGNGINNYFTDKGKAEKIKAMGSAVKEFALAVAILVGSIWVLSKIDYDTDMWKLFGLLSALVGVLIVLAGAMALISKIPNTNTSKLSVSMLALAASLYIMAQVFKSVSNIDDTQRENAIKSLEAIGLLFAALMIVAKFAGKSGGELAKVGTTMIAIVIALKLMTSVVKSASKMTFDDVLNGIKNLGAVSALFAALMIVAKFAGKSGAQLKSIGTTMLSMVAALGLMLFVVKSASKIKWDDIWNGIKNLTAISVFIGALLLVSNLAGKNAKQAGSMLLQMSLSILILIGVIKLISKMEPKDLVKGVAVIAVLEALFAGLIAVSKFAGDNAIKAGAMILEISIALLIITGVLFLLGKMDTAETWKAVGVVAILEALFAGLIYVSKYAGNAQKTIMTIAASLALLTVALVALSFINSERLKSSVIALISVMAALGLLMVATKFATTSIVSVVAIGVLTLVIGALIGLLFILNNLETDGLMTKVLALSTLLGTMSVVLGILTLVGMAGPAALVGVLSLIGLATALIAFLAIFGAINNDGKLEELVNKGIPLLEKVAYALGSFFGNIVKGFSEAVLSILPTLGASLSQFMINLTPFIAGAKMINGSVLEGIGILSAAIVALSVAEFIEFIADILTIGGSLADLGTKLSQFMINCLPFIATSYLIKPEAIDGVKTLTEAILLLSAANLIDGITRLFNLFSKEEDANSFSDKLSMFGKGLVAFAEEVNGIKNIDKVKNAAEAAKLLVEIANEIPTEGGILSLITGDKDLSKFGEKMKPFGEGLKDFAGSVESLDVGKVKQGVEAGNLIIDMASKIPNQGGLLAFITGDNSLDKFGSDISAFGTGLKGYGEAVSGLDLESVKKGVEAGNLIIDMANNIPNEGGLFALITGDNGLGKFGTDISAFGTGLKNYGDAVNGLNVEDIEKSEGAFDVFIRILDKLPQTDVLMGNALDFNQRAVESNGTFITPLLKLVAGIKQYAEAVTGIDISVIENSEVMINTLKRIVESLSGLSTESIESFTTAINELANISVTEFLVAWQESYIQFYDMGYEIINNLSLAIQENEVFLIELVNSIITQILLRFTLSKQQFYNTGVVLFEQLNNGMSSKRSAIYSMIINFMNQTVNKLRSYNSSYYQCGVYLGEGLINGINSMRTLVYQAAYNLGQAAVQGMQDGLNSHSPSRETYQLGIYAGQGLILGIYSMEDGVAEAANDMGKGVVDNISTALGLANAILNEDLDDNLTIRPVLDLSEVTEGAETISSLLNSSPIGVMANLGSISNDMNSKIQNGSESELASSINELRKDLSKIGGNTYYVGDVAYDDGSTVSDAVKALTDAVIIERRI